MTGSQRIALNTAASYLRSIFGMALGLFSSRWILQSLGSVDYGLMGVVGALIAFVAFLGGVTSNAVARFYAHSIGRGDPEETAKWFNTALSLHVIIPTVLIGIGWPVCEHALVYGVNIPPERLVTARWVFRFSLLSAFWSMSSTPYIGMFTAKQKIAERSLGDVIISLSNFLFVFFLTSYKGDAWLLYSGGTVLITMTVGAVQILRARRLFPECRICFRYWWDRSRVMQILSFSGWNLFGALGGLLRGQGSAILLNKYFNPAQYPFVNASYSVGNLVSGYTQTFSTSLLGAFTPEITALEGRGERNRMLQQSYRVSKFGAFLIMLFAIPLMLEADHVLVLWLKTPPRLAASFCRLMLAMFLIDKITFGQMVAVAAKGRIAGYQMMLGGFLILTLPLAWVLLRFGFDATAVGWAFVATTSLCSLGRIFWAQYLVGASAKKWVIAVFTPCVVAVLISMGCGQVIIALWSTPSLLRVCVVTLVTLVVNLMLGWFVILDKNEKHFVLLNGAKALRRLKRTFDKQLHKEAGTGSV